MLPGQNVRIGNKRIGQTVVSRRQKIEVNGRLQAPAIQALSPGLKIASLISFAIQMGPTRK
jgi:hypothetical protein